MTIPEGEVDAYAIVTGRRRFLEEEEVRVITSTIPFQPAVGEMNRTLADDAIKPGKGWQVVREKQGVCDGTYRSVCGRSKDEDCVLSGYHDS